MSASQRVGRGFHRLGLLATVITLVIVCGCAGTDLRTQTASLNPGQSKEQVLSVLGPPGNRSFSGNAEAWQYCRTGIQVDTYTTVWFLDGKVHRVTSQEAALAAGMCTVSYPTIDWGQMDTRITVRR